MKVAVIKYNAGNIQSVLFALQRVGIDAIWTDESDAIIGADKVIFPGVGNAKSAMESLSRKGLHHLIPQLKQPVLGICVGMQLLCNHSEEEDTQGLSIIPLEVKKFVPEKKELKVPQVGWNEIYDLSSPLFSDIKEKSFVYFVHSYFVTLGKETIAKAAYSVPYSASIHKDNFYGVQFHTEKSAGIGDAILKNFLNYT